MLHPNENSEIVGAEAAADRRELQKEIADLRADLEVLRGVVKNSNGAKVVQLKGSVSDVA